MLEITLRPISQRYYHHLKRGITNCEYADVMTVLKYGISQTQKKYVLARNPSRLEIDLPLSSSHAPILVGCVLDVS